MRKPTTTPTTSTARVRSGVRAGVIFNVYLLRGEIAYASRSHDSQRTGGGVYTP